MAMRALIPLVLLIALVYAFTARGTDLTAPITRGAANVPPVEALTFERIDFKPAQIVAYVRNSGPQELEIAQVHLNDMTVEAYIAPGKKIPRLGSATSRGAPGWVDAEPSEFRLVSAAGRFHAGTVSAAAMAPTAGARYLAVFALLGIYVGVIPLYLGLAWFPFLRR